MSKAALLEIATTPDSAVSRVQGKNGKSWLPFLLFERVVGFEFLNKLGCEFGVCFAEMI